MTHFIYARSRLLQRGAHHDLLRNEHEAAAEHSVQQCHVLKQVYVLVPYMHTRAMIAGCIGFLPLQAEVTKVHRCENKSAMCQHESALRDDVCGD